ncbi:alpha/beta fold hydrolase [Pseudomonas chlororaphis]|uniref:alpha/beta fold hydrolase n=1 Tax=Pseudomonas chlororaphis TaxID=587753 RepID=UPI00352B36AE
MSQMTQHALKLNGIELHLHADGPLDGPPVWLLHGFPECWYSWRRQVAPLTAAGYRVLIPQMRGYGDSSAPEEVAAYDVLTLCADIQQAMDALGQEQACIVGHDWGAVVAWHLALLEPQRVKALVTLSVPFAGRPKRPAVEIMAELFAERFNYILYFQEPGVAERELDADIDRSLLHFMHDCEHLLDEKSPSALLFDGMPPHLAPPAWCTPEDFAVYRRTFAGRGFRGALNWYRNFERNWQRTEHLGERQVSQPTLFMIGDRDPVGQLEARTMERMPGKVPRLEQHRLVDCGHWIQSERAEEVNLRLLDFLGRNYPCPPAVQTGA